ncbi:serine protease [Saccharopolyspora sp. NPDC002686]|uniref:DUF6923 family protein n=1 Tax=Saccharopolyspora sp. NPDC002686 TaxID=3154541 RepID=UPI00331B37FE
MWWRAAAASAALVLLASVTWVLSAAAVPECSVLQVRNRGGPSAAYRVDFPAATSTRLDPPGYRLNALGYAASQHLVYAVGDGGRAVALTADGQARELGPIRAGREGTWWYPLSTPDAGAISGNRWYLAESGYLYTVDVRPGSRTFLEVLSMVAIEDRSWRSFDDFDVDPVDGELYGIGTTRTGASALVRLDRGSGRVAEVVDVPQLPPLSYGSVVIGSDRALYVTANESGGMYRVERGGAVTRLATVLPMLSSDAAGCLSGEAPPPVPPPTSSTTTSPTSTTSPTTTPSPVPTPTTTTRPPSSPASEPEPTPEPSSEPPLRTSAKPGNFAPPTQERDAESSGHSTGEKRRWALAALVLLIGGSAAVRRLAR